MTEYIKHFVIMDRTDAVFGMQLGKGIVYVHGPAMCAGEFCCIHNPSDHHMKTWDRNWRADRHMMERICPAHGVGHPDPDDIDYKKYTIYRKRVFGLEDFTHGCCGCCAEPQDI